MPTFFLVRFNKLVGAINKRILLVIVIGITLLGLYLRYRCLGCLGFRWDEDITSLAIRALSETGIPQLPSGMIYTRFYPFQWMMAASVDFFGFSEFSMRLPAVLFGTTLIPAAYLVTRKLLTMPTALIVATCIALSFQQVEMARTARMYAPFFFVYLIAAYSIYCAYYQNTDRVFSPWVLPLALLALSIHQLAYSLAILLLPAIFLRRSIARTFSLLLQAGGIGAAFIVLKSAQEHFFYVADRAAESAGISQSLETESGPIAALFAQISLPNTDLLAQVFSIFPLGLVVLSIVAVILGMWIARAVWSRNALYRFLALAAIALSVVHQFNLVLLILAIMLISLKGGVQEVKNPAWYRPAISCFSVLVLWLVVVSIINSSIPSEMGITSQGIRKTLRALFDYPDFRLFWSYVLERPLLSLPLALGTLWGIDKISKDRPDATALFIVASFWLVLFANGILETKFDFFRYNLHIDVFYLMLVVTGLFSIPDLLAKFDISLPATLQKYSSGRHLAIVVAAISISGVNPIAATLTSARDYRETTAPYTWLGLDRYDDFATPAAYVRERLQDDDIILVLDPREFWNYIGRVDYWIWSDNYESQTYQANGRAHDLYLGIPVLHKTDEVRAVIANRKPGNTWILFSRARLARTRWISEDLKTYLNSLEDQVVYVGRDEQTVVIRITTPSQPRS